jgi:hypothetical protein
MQGGMKNIVNVWRDGRDVMVSWYHHCLFLNEITNPRFVERARKDPAFESNEKHEIGNNDAGVH